MPGVVDVELIYHIWQYNGSIYGPYAAEAMCQFFVEEKLQFPTRIQITESRKKGEPVLDWFGTTSDLQDIFGMQNFFPKRLSQFMGKWGLPEVHPNPVLFQTNPHFLSFNLVTFLTNLTISPYCPFVTGVDGDVPEEHALPFTSAVLMARSLLMEYANFEPDERQHLHILLTEVFTPRYCEVCEKIIEDQHSYMMHALSFLHIENTIVKGKRTFTIDFDYMKLRKLMNDVKKYTFDRKLCRIITKIANPKAPVLPQLQMPPPFASLLPQLPVWPPTWTGTDFPRTQPLQLL